MSTNPQLKQLLGAIFDRFQDVEDPTLFAQHREEFIFHMTDWLDDWERLSDLYQNPEKYKATKASKLVAGFLYHAIPHLKAAGRLLLDEVPDAFDEPPVRESPKHTTPVAARPVENEEETATT